MTHEVTSKRHRCEDCPFGGPKVGTRGPLDSPFMIIGESPGKNELREGLPFVGVSWRVMLDALQKTGLLYPEPFVTNAFHCFPGTTQKNEDTLNRAASACRHQLLDEINSHPRKLIITLGSAAIRSVTNNFQAKITKERGRYIKDDLYNDVKGVEHVIATIHPAYILRGGGNARQFKGDIRYALSLLNGGDIKRNPVVDYVVLDTPRLLRRLLDAMELLPANTLVASDLETGSSPDDPGGPGGFNHIDDSILMVGLAWRADAVYIIPEEMILHPYTRRIFQLANIKWIWHNGKFDIKFLWSYGIPEARVDHDTMLMSYTLDEKRGTHDLEEVAHDWLGAPRWKDILDQHKRPGQSYRVIPKPILYKYAAFDISNTLRLYHVMQPEIDGDEDNAKIYHRTFIPASAMLAEVEDWGINVDPANVKENYGRLSAICTKNAEPIFEWGLKFFDASKGIVFNEKMPNSPKQLAVLLYDCLKFPTKDRSTGDDALEELPDHPVVKALRQYRKFKKQLSTNVKPLLDTVDEKGKIAKSRLCSDKRMHTTFKLHATATGRLASSDPMNLQNVPRDGDIRGQFVASRGRIFVEPDLNQAELRSLAIMSNDSALCAVYENQSGPGLHDVVRAEMFGNPQDWSLLQFEKYIARFFVSTDQAEAKIIKAILDEQKMRAKNVNFGIVYGITRYGLADQTGDTHQQAQQYIDAWANKFPDAWKFITMCKNAPRNGLDLVTVFGNRKRHHVVTQENLQALQNEAANFPHQCTASHIMLHGAIRVYRRYREDYDVRICNLVHDSMLLDVPNDPHFVKYITEDVCNVLQQVPRDWGLRRIPFLAEAKVGVRWGRNSQVPYSEWLKAHAEDLTLEGDTYVSHGASH